MDADTSFLLDQIIVRQEGGYKITSEPDGSDGGWTCGGVTAISWNEKFTARTSAEINDMLFNSRLQLQRMLWDIYEQRYITPISLSSFNIILQGPFLSCAINCGTATAIKLMQITIDPAEKLIKNDGIMGAKTIMAYDTAKDHIKLSDFLYVWMRHYVRICVAQPEKLADLEGWLNRVEFWRYYIPPSILAAASNAMTGTPSAS